MPSVCFIYGFSEGPWHSKRFEAALQANNFDITKTVAAADIVIAHSGGSFYVPKLRAEQVLLLINPPYWPGKSLSRRARDILGQIVHSIRPGNQPWYHLNKTAHNLGNALGHPRANSDMVQAGRRYNLYDQASVHPRTILIRNYKDPWLTPDIKRLLLPAHPKLRIHELSGDHDDCWLHPTPYINLLQSEL